MKFKEKDRIRMKEDCGSVKKGEVLEVSEREGNPFVYGDARTTCTCQEKWELISGFPIDEYEWLKVGDLVDVHEDSYHFGGQKGLKIEGVRRRGFGEYSITDDEGLCHYVSAMYVRPHVPEEVEEMTLEEVCKELGREIKIVKE